MIVKDDLARHSTDRFQRAGNEAEQQMAFYLKRAFGDNPTVHVFHNLRLKDGLEVAQIDHLILHRYGAILIESKSVTSAVSINERDEWMRQWNGRWMGMPSPILQAQRQADVLRKVMRACAEEVLDKALFGLLQRGFGKFVFNVVVAISDQGVIQHQGQLPEVCKADQVPDRVRELMHEQAGLASLTSKDPRSKDWGMALKPEELVRTSEFLKNAHRERPAPELVEASPQVASVLKFAKPERSAKPKASPFNFKCQQCASTRLEVTYGQYGYYFKCLGCESNTRIDLKCPSCGGKLKTRKSKKEFFAECKTCDTSKLYYTNSD